MNYLLKLSPKIPTNVPKMGGERVEDEDDRTLPLGGVSTASSISNTLSEPPKMSQKGTKRGKCPKKYQFWMRNVPNVSLVEPPNSILGPYILSPLRSFESHYESCVSDVDCNDSDVFGYMSLPMSPMSRGENSHLCVTNTRKCRLNQKADKRKGEKRKRCSRHRRRLTKLFQSFKNMFKGSSIFKSKGANNTVNGNNGNGVCSLSDSDFNLPPQEIIKSLPGALLSPPCAPNTRVFNMHHIQIIRQLNEQCANYRAYDAIRGLDNDVYRQSSSDSTTSGISSDSVTNIVSMIPCYKGDNCKECPRSTQIVSYDAKYGTIDEVGALCGVCIGECCLSKRQLPLSSVGKWFIPRALHFDAVLSVISSLVCDRVLYQALKENRFSCVGKKPCLMETYSDDSVKRGPRKDHPEQRLLTYGDCDPTQLLNTTFKHSLGDTVLTQSLIDLIEYCSNPTPDHNPTDIHSEQSHPLNRALIKFTLPSDITFDFVESIVWDEESKVKYDDFTESVTTFYEISNAVNVTCLMYKGRFGVGGRHFMGTIERKRYTHIPNTDVLVLGFRSLNPEVINVCERYFDRPTHWPKYAQMEKNPKSGSVNGFVYSGGLVFTRNQTTNEYSVYYINDADCQITMVPKWITDKVMIAQMKIVTNMQDFILDEWKKVKGGRH